MNPKSSSDNLDTLINHRYLLKEQLGAGNTGIVYRAVDRLSQQSVAIKILHRRNIFNNPDRHVALVNEFEILASLRHPNIVSVRDYFFTDSQLPCLVMDYVENAQTFTQSGKQQSNLEKMKLSLQLLEALAYLHRRGILHHDLNPTNVLVTNGVVRVVDFGFSLLAENDDSKTGGTIAYLAPEVLRKQQRTHLSELYTVGLLIYELLAGRFPFVRQPLIALINGIMNEELDFGQFGLPDSAVVALQKLVGKEPLTRHPTALAAINALQDALDFRNPAHKQIIEESYLQSAPLVGRRAEIAQLLEYCAETQKGATQVCLLGGESGVGKSRLADEFRIRVIARGVSVLKGHALEQGGLPYQVWRRPIRRLILSQELTDFHASVLKEIVPDIDELLDRYVPELPALNGAAQHQRLVTSIINVLRNAHNPLTLILEDLQWADESLDIIKQVILVADRIGGVLILGTYRNDERPQLPHDLKEANVIEIGRLQDEELIELSKSILGGRGAKPELVRLLAKETEGITYFVVEVMRTWAEETGQLARIAAESVSRNILTQGMHDLLRRRIRKLPEEDHRTLGLVAVAGRQLNMKVLLQVASPESLESWLYRASDAAIIEFADGQWRFTHDKLREAILTELDYMEQSLLHRKIAEAIATAYPDDPEYYAILLEHWHRAGDIDLEVDYLNLVAEQLSNTSAYARLSKLLERGLEALDANDTRRVSLAIWLAKAQAILGQPARARTLANEVLSLAEQAGDTKVFAQSQLVLGHVCWQLGEPKASIEHLQQSVHIFESIEVFDDLAMALNLLGLNLAAVGDIDRAKMYLMQSLALSQKVGIKATTSVVYNNLAYLRRIQGDYEQAKQDLRLGLDLSEAIGYISASVVARTNLSLILHLQGQYEAAKEIAVQNLTLSREIGYQIGESYSLSRLGQLSTDSGDFFVAEDYLLQALSLQETLHLINVAARTQVAIGTLFLRQGKFYQAQEKYAVGLRVFRKSKQRIEIAHALLALGQLHIELRDRAAVACFHEALTIASEIQAIPTILESLLYFALFRVNQRQISEAVQLFQFVNEHPISNVKIASQLAVLQAALEANYVSERLNTIDTLNITALTRNCLNEFILDKANTLFN